MDTGSWRTVLLRPLPTPWTCCFCCCVSPAAMAIGILVNDSFDLCLERLYSTRGPGWPYKKPRVFTNQHVSFTVEHCRAQGRTSEVKRGCDAERRLYRVSLCVRGLLFQRVCCAVCAG